MNSTTATNVTNLVQTVNRVGLGYGIAITVGVLMLMSTILLAAYVCVRMQSATQQHSSAQQRRRADDPNSATVVPEAMSGEHSIFGLDQATVETYPKIVYDTDHSTLHPDNSSCSICLADYEDTDILRMLPDCRHVFHAPCIDAWLRLHASCPICRTSPLPTPQTTPISTPLSDLIPLARHPLQTRYTSDYS